MAYNSPDELLRIEDIFRRKSLAAGAVEAAPSEVRLPAGQYRPAAKWLQIFEEWSPALQRAFVDIRPKTSSRAAALIEALKLFIEKGWRAQGHRRARAGRINLLGRHIDHRGGAINVMAIDRDGS